MDNLAGDLLQEVLSRLGLTVPRQTLTPYAPYVPALALDMTRSQAFSLPTDWQGLIRINLRGREPRGVVAAGAYDAVCEELDTELRGLRHRRPDAPVVDRVVRIRDVFAGPFVDALPDLSVLWNPEVVVTEVTSPRAGAFRREPDLSGGGGNHQGVGFMLASGASVPRGRFTGHVFDVAPTVAGLLGERPRPEWDGVVLAFANPAPAA
jgi:predicted AlkP superfamily phosphohydrolase/phosphomutase